MTGGEWLIVALFFVLFMFLWRLDQATRTRHYELSMQLSQQVMSLSVKLDTAIVAARLAQRRWNCAPGAACAARRLLHPAHNTGI